MGGEMRWDETPSPAAAHVCGGCVIPFFFSKLRRVFFLSFSPSPISFFPNILFSVCFQNRFLLLLPLLPFPLFQESRSINKRLRRRRRCRSLNALEGEKSVKVSLISFKATDAFTSDAYNTDDNDDDSKEKLLISAKSGRSTQVSH